MMCSLTPSCCASSLRERKSHRMEVAGFSSPPTSPRWWPNLSRPAARSLTRFARETLWRSLGQRWGSPRGKSEERRGAGSPRFCGARLAREKVSQGVPAMMPHTKPPVIHPLSSENTAGRAKSKFRPFKMSIVTTAFPCLRSASARCSLPEKRSMKTRRSPGAAVRSALRSSRRNARRMLAPDPRSP